MADDQSEISLLIKTRAELDGIIKTKTVLTDFSKNAGLAGSAVAFMEKALVQFNKESKNTSEHLRLAKEEMKQAAIEMEAYAEEDKKLSKAKSDLDQRVKDLAGSLKKNLAPAVNEAAAAKKQLKGSLQELHYLIPGVRDVVRALQGGWVALTFAVVAAYNAFRAYTKAAQDAAVVSQELSDAIQPIKQAGEGAVEAAQHAEKFAQALHDVSEDANKAATNLKAANEQAAFLNKLRDEQEAAELKLSKALINKAVAQKLMTKEQGDVAIAGVEVAAEKKKEQNRINREAKALEDEGFALALTQRQKEQALARAEAVGLAISGLTDQANREKQLSGQDEKKNAIIETQAKAAIERAVRAQTAVDLGVSRDIILMQAGKVKMFGKPETEASLDKMLKDLLEEYAQTLQDVKVERDKRAENIRAIEREIAIKNKLRDKYDEEVLANQKQFDEINKTIETKKHEMETSKKILPGIEATKAEADKAEGEAKSETRRQEAIKRRPELLDRYEREWRENLPGQDKTIQELQENDAIIKGLQEQKRNVSSTGGRAADALDDLGESMIGALAGISGTAARVKADLDQWKDDQLAGRVDMQG